MQLSTAQQKRNVFRKSETCFRLPPSWALTPFHGSMLTTFAAPNSRSKKDDNAKYDEQILTMLTDAVIDTLNAEQMSWRGLWFARSVD
jgi:hypothetical protein